MTLHTKQLPSIPALAWHARFDKLSNTVELFHGSGVELRGDRFVEGCWDGDFAEFDFIDAEVMCGSGGSITSEAAYFRGSSDRLAPLVSIETEQYIHVSNSIMFLLAAAKEELDPIYPYYPYDLIRIWRQGDHCPSGELRLKSKNHLRVHFGAIIKVLAGGKTSYEIPRAGEAPSDYLHYKSMLSAKVQSVISNAEDEGRGRPASTIAALTQGYDSTATCILAREAGCKDAFSIADSQSPDPQADTGRENAERLQMAYHEVDRWEFMNMSHEKAAELSLFALASNAPMAAAEGLMKQKLLVTGNRGDIVWGMDKGAVHQKMEHTWCRFLSGVNMMEFRLRAGFFILSPATIMERHSDLLNQITHSKEMEPWKMNNAYDRPIARRIIEEGGLPRGTFGNIKAGTGHYGFRYDPECPSLVMSAYGKYLNQSHQNIAKPIVAFWKARYWMDKFIWNKLTPNETRAVRSNKLQRRFPYILNISPLKLRWESSFTLQWASSIIKPRYQVTADDE